MKLRKHPSVAGTDSREKRRIFFSSAKVVIAFSICRASYGGMLAILLLSVSVASIALTALAGLVLEPFGMHWKGSIDFSDMLLGSMLLIQGLVMFCRVKREQRAISYHEQLHYMRPYLWRKGFRTEQVGLTASPG